jgi:serine/threonine-protein kinase HipA
MTDAQILVHVDLDGVPVLAGRLWTRVRRGKESASFEYDSRWLAHPRRFSLEPALALGPGPFHTPAGKSLFGALGDSAPDRWGRALMRRAERRRAERAGETKRTLREIDYLLRVDDEARQGALRLGEVEGGPRTSPRPGPERSAKIASPCRDRRTPRPSRPRRPERPRPRPRPTS